MTRPLSRSLGSDALALTLQSRWLIARFDREHAVLSAAIVGGGRRRAWAVAWHEVRDNELKPPVDPRQLLTGRLAAKKLSSVVGLLTSRDLGKFVATERRSGKVSAQVVATVGLGNALRAGDPPGLRRPAGTINILCRVSEPLSAAAEIEMLSIVAEARTLAVLEARVPSRRSGHPATGTGTDCIVVASPVGRGATQFSGKHTEIGHVVGAAVLDAIRQGVAAWLAEQKREATLAPE